MFLTLRGLCKDSNIDRFWVTRNIEAELFYLGIQNTEMWYDYGNKHWNIREISKLCSHWLRPSQCCSIIIVMLVKGWPGANDPTNKSKA